MTGASRARIYALVRAGQPARPAGREDARAHGAGDLDHPVQQHLRQQRRRLDHHPRLHQLFRQQRHDGGGGLDLRHRRDLHLQRSAAQDLCHQQCRADRAVGRAGAAAGRDGHLSPHPPDADHHQQRPPADGRQGRARAGRRGEHRGIARRDRPAFGIRRGDPRSRRDAAFDPGPGRGAGLRHHDPPAQRDHDRRRPAAGRARAPGAGQPAHPHPAVAQRAGQHRRRAACQGPAARAAHQRLEAAGHRRRQPVAPSRGSSRTAPRC